MHILHAACSMRPPTGIIKQMEEEQKSANLIGCDWSVILFAPIGCAILSEIIVESKYIKSKYMNNLLYKIFAWIVIRIEFYIFLYKYKNIDKILLRYSVHDIFQLIFLMICDNDVFLVHHTLELPELKLNKSFVGKIRYILERQIGKYCLIICDGIIGVTQEIINHELFRIEYKEKKTYLLPNGILSSTNSLLEDLREDNRVNILFLASYFYEWHGLDILISRLRDANTPYTIHIVGEVSLEDKVEGGKVENIIFYGLKDIDFIRDLASKCDVGLASFALYRKDMKEACTLKVREYLSFGIPVYGGYKEVFPSDFDYYHFGELDIEKIINFGLHLKSVERKEIYEASLPFIDKRYILTKFLKNLDN